MRELPRVWSGAAAAEARPQDESQATSAPKLCKHDAVLDFSRTAEALTNQVAMSPVWKAIFEEIHFRCSDCARPAECYRKGRCRHVSPAKWSGSSSLTLM